ncbi:hypothetical protein IWW55_006419, partial [Coemansia sp. RSA 2706]
NSDAASNGGSLYLAEGAARGAEYGQAPQYMWPQEPKHAPPAYGYQQGHQGHQGQAGYRRRGSGSGAQAGQRDRRGHHGSYHHRQRWNNGSNGGGYGRQSHGHGTANAGPAAAHSQDGGYSGVPAWQ